MKGKSTKQKKLNDVEPNRYDQEVKKDKLTNCIHAESLHCLATDEHRLIVFIKVVEGGLGLLLPIKTEFVRNLDGLDQ